MKKRFPLGINLILEKLTSKVHHYSSQSISKKNHIILNRPIDNREEHPTGKVDTDIIRNLTSSWSLAVVNNFCILSPENMYFGVWGFLVSVVVTHLCQIPLNLYSQKQAVVIVS